MLDRIVAFDSPNRIALRARAERRIEVADQTIIVGDCAAALALMPEGSVDVVVHAHGNRLHERTDGRIEVLLGLERFRWEGADALTPGKHAIVFDFKYDGPGMGKGGTGVLSVDGKEAARKTIPHTIPALVTVDESFDVGVDTRTGVDDNDYQLPFRFTGKLAKLTIKLVPMTVEEENALKKQAQDAKNRGQ